MRIAIVSDIHGNRYAFDAVLADLRETAPDLILHGGDLAHGGASPAYIIDRIRDLGWQGVRGNTDEMLFRPEALADFAATLPHLQPMFARIEEMAAWDREALGEDRIQWLSNLQLQHLTDSIALVHASPESCWRAPGPDATEAEVKSVYGPLSKPMAIYGHIHRPYVRKISAANSAAMIVANTGSVSLSYDGDPRASYLLVGHGQPQIRRVQYDVEKEIKALATSAMPHPDWMAKTLRAASPQMP